MWGYAARVACLPFGIYGTLNTPGRQYFCVISPLDISGFSGFSFKNIMWWMRGKTGIVHTLDSFHKPILKPTVQPIVKSMAQPTLESPPSLPAISTKNARAPHEVPGHSLWFLHGSCSRHGLGSTPLHGCYAAATWCSPSRESPRRSARRRSAAPAQSTRSECVPAQCRRGRR